MWRSVMGCSGSQPPYAFDGFVAPVGAGVCAFTMTHASPKILTNNLPFNVRHSLVIHIQQSLAASRGLAMANANRSRQHTIGGQRV